MGVVADTSWRAVVALQADRPGLGNQLARRMGTGAGGAQERRAHPGADVKRKSQMQRARERRRRRVAEKKRRRAAGRRRWKGAFAGWPEIPLPIAPGTSTPERT